MSKRRLLRLVQEGHVGGWDDPRMPTLAGLRRRGYTPEAIRDFWERIGVAKANSVVDLALLEHCVREDLNRRAARVMAVLRPLRLVIENYPEGQVEELEAVNNPEDPAMGVRKVPFSRVLWIERDDVREVPPPKYFRLYPGNEVRLRYAYIVRCTSVVKDERTGEIVEVRCTYDPASRGGQAARGPARQGDDPLGLGGPRRDGGGAPLRPALHPPEPRRRGGGRGLHDAAQPRVAGGGARGIGWSRAWPALRRAAASSSSASATSRSTPTRRRGGWS